MTSNEPTPTRAPSLLERAAKVYDFNQHVRARGGEAPVPPVAAAFDDVPFADAPTFDEPVFGNPTPAALQGATDRQPIDRMMLAEAGMIVPGAPIGPLAEEFRLVKRQLLIASQRIAESSTPDKARTILVCSARPRDGKTFTAVNLALSIAAERDVEVLLVDADFAKPDVMARLGLDDGLGLLDALADSSIDVETLVVRTDVPNLSLLSAGTKTSSDNRIAGQRADPHGLGTAVVRRTRAVS